MNLLSRIGLRIAPKTNRRNSHPARGRVNGEDVAVLLRDAGVVTPRQSVQKIEQVARSWSDNCSDLSRMEQDRGNVKVLTKEKCQVLAERNSWSIERAKGFVDGETCRVRGKKPSKYALIGIDEYSLGFRAGYFERRNGVRSTMDVPRGSSPAQQI